MLNKRDNKLRQEKTYIESEGIRFYGELRRFLSAQEIERAVSSPESILHVTRHITCLSPNARKKILKLTIIDGGEKIKVNDAFIDAQLQSIGSKFNEKINDPFKLLENCRAIAMEQIKEEIEIPWIYNSRIDEAVAKIKVRLSDGQKQKLGILSSEFVGNLSVVKVTSEIRQHLQKEQRGKGEKKDRVKINVVEGIDKPLTNDIVIAFKKHGLHEQPEFYTVYTGILTALIPRQEEQSDEEFLYNTGWWENYTFIK